MQALLFNDNLTLLLDVLDTPLKVVTQLLD